MSHMGGFGRRRGMAVAAIVLALCVVAPELATGAGAATPTARGATAQPATHVVLVARHRSRAARRRAHVLSFLRRHPNYLKRKFHQYPGQLARALRKRGIKVKSRPARKAAKSKRKRRVYVTAKSKKRRATAAKKKRRRRVAVAGTLAAKKKKKKGTTSAKSSGKPLGMKGWLEIGLLVLAPFAAVALLLYITDWRRRPRAPSRSKRRRSLVITPLNKH